MELFGASIQSVYLTTLIIAGALTLLYILLGDLLEGLAELIPFINPALILAFITFFSASGYLFELLTSLNSMIIVIISILIALLLDTLLNIFILIPLSSAQESLAYSNHSLRGRIGKVIIPIPEDGFGEVILKSASGTVAKSAVSFKGESIEEGQNVLVVEVQNGVLHVVPHETQEDFLF
ncbi:NfeD family protein [Robertmurraya massiliosenegalensis]|uniref:NfeD family protein n=1 Tax=Robertmurraya TaxID=2837507 RepID=UPI0039A65CD7